MNEFERNLRDRLRSSEQQLDSDTVRSLHSARKNAVDQSPGFKLPKILVPIGGMALASIAVFLLVFSPIQQSSNQTRDSLILDQREIQDLDFYYWLAETQDVTGS